MGARLKKLIINELKIGMFIVEMDIILDKISFFITSKSD